MYLNIMSNFKSTFDRGLYESYKIEFENDT